MAETRLFLSCEHGGNEVPPAYRHLFQGREEVLATHRGYDIGILGLAEKLARELDAPLEAATVTRLLVDLNRARHNRTLFSEFTRDLPAVVKEEILARYYHPYRARATGRVEALLGQIPQVVHVAVHSFTPVFQGEARNADLGLLYDPARPRETRFCRIWQQELERCAPALRVRRNYPYRGASDALVTTLRRRLPPGRYLGLELEVNQQLPVEGGVRWRTAQRALADALNATLRRWAQDTQKNP